MKVTIILEPLNCECASISGNGSGAPFSESKIIGKKEIIFNMYAYSGEQITINVSDISREIMQLHSDINIAKEKLKKLGVT